MHAGPVRVRGNRALPLKAELIDENGQPVNDLDIVAPPVIQVMFQAGTAPAVDVTSDAVSVGAGTDGNQFAFLDGRWHLNLKTFNFFTAAGTYTIIMDSGDNTEYLVEPICTASFVVY